MSEKSLYERLGGYDAISAVTNDLFIMYPENWTGD
jgi:hypothetical protein